MFAPADVLSRRTFSLNCIQSSWSKRGVSVEAVWTSREFQGHIVFAAKENTIVLSVVVAFVPSLSW
eukprot:COSAG06_NODE_228_length_19725_cov_8.167839_21_plen_66_part_00